MLPFAANRRQALGAAACGFGQLALHGLLPASAGASAPIQTPHFAPRAKRVIFLFMQGGPSQVDSFDYKPLLEKRHGTNLAFDDARTIAKTGKRGSSQLVKKSLWKFRQYGESGRWVSDLFPEIGSHADQLCMLHSLHTEGIAHGPATLFLHCGATWVRQEHSGCQMPGAAGQRHLHSQNARCVSAVRCR